jgi:hypothetical protein
VRKISEDPKQPFTCGGVRARGSKELGASRETHSQRVSTSRIQWDKQLDGQR